MSKLGRRDRHAPSKALAFDSSSPRFKHGSDLAMVHARSRTLDYSKEELSKPVYDLQMLEGPQVKVRNQLQVDSEIASPRPVKKNTMGIGVFR